MTRNKLIECGALVTMTLVVYVPAIRGGFIWDDDLHVTRNPTLRNVGGLWRVWFEIGALPQYYPLVHTTYWVEYRLWGQNPLGYHTVNVLLHAASAVLVWQLLRCLSVPGAWFAAAVFALHPVHVESVAWVTERKNTLSGFFYLAAALLYLRLVLDPDVPGRARWRRLVYALSLGLFLCALLSKTVTASLPAALLLILWWKHGRMGRREVLGLLPMFAIAVPLGMLTVWMEKHYVGARGVAWEFSITERCLIAGRALCFYVGKLLWPHPLTFIYPRWRVDATVWWQYLFPLAALAVIVALYSARRRIGRGPLIAVLCFAGTLAPALGFFDVFPMQFSFVADHFQYLASIAVIALAVSTSWTVLERIGRIGVRLIFVGVPAVLIVLGVLAWHQCAIYQDLETLWRDTIRKNPECWMAEVNLGLISDGQGKIHEAAVHYQRALRIKPDCAEAHNNFGTILSELGRLSEAKAHFEQALRNQPDYVDAHINLGNVWQRLGDRSQARTHYEHALRIQPDRAEVHNALGALLEKDDPKQALVHYRQALTLNPALETAARNLVRILAASYDPSLRNGQEAVQWAVRCAQATGYTDPGMLDILAAAYAEAGNFAEAIKWQRKATELVPAREKPDFSARLELYKAGKPFRWEKNRQRKPDQ